MPTSNSNGHVTGDANGLITLHCADCGLPFARIHNGTLIIESRHHGEVHRNVFAIFELMRLVESQGIIIRQSEFEPDANREAVRLDT